MSSPESINIINPEVPETPAGKLELLRRCLAVIANQGAVEGVTPRHVAQEGMYMIQTAQLSREKRVRSAL